jgi:hypothetical protein
VESGYIIEFRRHRLGEVSPAARSQAGKCRQAWLWQRCQALLKKK